MQRPLYCFVPKNKIEIKTPQQGKLFIFGINPGGGRPSLRENEYNLAMLFDGRRSEEEIRDLLAKNHGVSLSAEDLAIFRDKLIEAGLLEQIGGTPGSARPGAAFEGENAGAAPYIMTLTREGGRAGSGPLSWHRRRGAMGVAASGRGQWSQHAQHAPHAAPPAPQSGPWSGSGHAQWTPPRAARSASQTAAAEDVAFDEAALAEEASLIQEEAPTTPLGGGAPTPHISKYGRLALYLPFDKVIPLAEPFAWGVRHRYLTWLMVFLCFCIGIGLYLSRIDLLKDVARWFYPLTVLHSLVISTITINLFSQLARAAEYRRHVGETPRFGIRLLYNIWPRFAVELPNLDVIKDRKAVRAIVGSTISATATLCMLTYLGWFLTKNNGTHLSLFCLSIAVLSTLRLIFALNPLGKTDGYALLTLTLNVPDLRQRAFVTLVCFATGKPLPPAWGKKIPSWVLLCFALGVLGFFVALGVFTVIIAGGWLEANWGGFGVLFFITVAVVMFWEPVREARARLDARRARMMHEAPSVPRWRKWVKPALVALGLLIIGLLPYRYEPGGDFVLKPLQTSRTDVRSMISGQVAEIPLKEGDYVEKDQVLARISGNEERKNVDSTEASIRSLEAQLAKAQSGATQEEIDVARQRVASAKTRYEFSSSKKTRYEQLKSSGFSSPQEYENILSAAENDREALTQAEKELKRLLAGTRSEEIDALRASVDQQKANLAYYKQQLEFTEIRAPISGYIVSGSLLTSAGAYLKNGDLFVTIQDTKHLLAEIKVPQFDIGYVRAGAPIRLRAWQQPDLEISGTVQLIAPSAEDSQGGKMVRVMSELDNSNGQLKSGLTGYAKIEGESMPTALAFTRVILRFFQVELWSWLP